MGDLVCLDANVVIWGVKKEASEGQEDMIDRALLLIDKLAKRKANIMIPAPVLGEILIRVPAEEQSAILSGIQKRFMIYPFDGRAALKFVEIARSKPNIIFNSSPNNNGHNEGKKHINFDRMTVAIAVVNGANIIYSHDNHIKVFSDGFINYSELPEVEHKPEQLNLI